MTASRILTLALMMLVSVAAAASAQSFRSAEMGYKATVSLTGGLVRGLHDDLPVVGVSLVYDLDRWIALESRAGYFSHQPGRGGQELLVGGSVLMNLVPPRNRVIPYVAAGAGLHYLSFVGSSVNVGSGIRVAVNDRLTVRPDLRMILVFGEGARRSHAVYSVDIGYRF